MTHRWLLLACGMAVGSGSGSAQSESGEYWFEISASMGIDAFSAPSVTDYVNIIAQPADRIEEFSTAVEFAVTPEFRISKSWSAGLDYNYLIKSYSAAGVGGESMFTYGIHLPFLVVHYVIPWKGSRLKVGGGAGMAIASFEERLFGSSSVRNSRAQGGGLKLEAIGNSRFDDHFYGVLAVEMRWVIGEAFHQNLSGTRNITPKLNYFSIGLKFGVEFVW